MDRRAAGCGGAWRQRGGDHLVEGDADEVFWAIVHSHVRSPAYPSPTDVGLALYPDAIYLLVSLAEEEPALGAFRIVEGEIHRIEILVGEPA